MADAVDAKNLADALEFINKICSAPNHIIKPFFLAFSDLRSGIWGFEEFNHRISIIFCDYPDLMNDLYTFLTIPDRSFDFGLHRNDFNLWRPFCAKVLSMCATSEQGAEFLIPFYRFSNIDKSDFQNRVEDFLREFPPELIVEFRIILDNQLYNSESEKPIKEKVKTSREVELDSEHSEDPASMNDEYLNAIDFDPKEVLNSTVCLSKNLIPEYKWEKSQEQTSVEEITKEFEDVMVELDLTLFSVRSAVQRLEKLFDLGFIENIGDHLNAMNLRCINQIYKSASKEELDYIFQNPEKGIHVLLRRLRQKEEELLAIKDELKTNSGIRAMEYYQDDLDFLKKYFGCVI